MFAIEPKMLAVIHVDALSRHHFLIPLNTVPQDAGKRTIERVLPKRLRVALRAGMQQIICVLALEDSRKFVGVDRDALLP